MDLYKTDPEFAERFEYFAFNEVVNEENQQLEPYTRYLAILAVLIGCGGVETYQEMLPQALANGITPIIAKEIVYQATDYLGYGRILPFLNITNKILTERNIALPLDGQATTTLDNRLEKGIEAQAEIFGEHMKEDIKQDISTVGWQQTASAITIPVEALTWQSVNSLPFVSLWRRAAVSRS